VAVTRSLSPSAGKPAAVVASWRERGLPIRLVAPLPVTVDDFALAHERSFVEDVLAYRREAIVFKGMRLMGVPVAWNLAGGYQTPLRRVLDIHDGTMIECVRAYLGGAA
jgi:hypothetical protein